MKKQHNADIKKTNDVDKEKITTAPPKAPVCATQLSQEEQLDLLAEIIADLIINLKK